MKKSNCSIQNRMSALVHRFGEHLSELIINIKPDFIIPLETKGAILMELAFGGIKKQFSDHFDIIYPRALDYLPIAKLRSSRFLIVDDAVFSGKTLKAVTEILEKKGVPSTGVHLTALFDFTSGQPDEDYHADIKDRLIIFQDKDSSIISRKDALQFIHHQILTERMPSTYDHLLFKSQNVQLWQYNNLLSYAAETNRLLDYGRRGSFLTSSILLDDLFKGEWDFPPKLRLWYHPDQKVLRMAPVASPVAYSTDTYRDEQKNVEEIFLEGLGEKSEQTHQRAFYDAFTFNMKLQVLPYLDSYVTEAGIQMSLDKTHLDRYYPGISEKLSEKAQLKNIIIKLPQRIDENQKLIDEPFLFLETAKKILVLLKGAYESQSEIPKRRKDFDNKGFTGKELFEKFSEYTRQQVHAAIDYCFDMNYATAFIREGEKPARGMRSTEIREPYHIGEIYAAIVIYSQSLPTPAWLINKVFPIVANTGGGPFDGALVIQKGPFGDYVNVMLSESTTSYLGNVPSDLWNISGSAEEKDLKFIPKPDKKSIVADLSRDHRIAGHRTHLEATLFLCDQFKRKGSILLNIATGQCGGIDYIAFNIEKIIGHTIGKALNERKQHIAGVLEKLEIITSLYTDGENLLTKLADRCSRLGRLAPLTAIEAEAIVAQTKVLSERKLYDVLKELAGHVIVATEECLKNKAGVIESFVHLGISETGLRNKNANSQLFYASSFIYNWLYALSMRECNQKHYESFIYQTNSFGQRPFILAYDLTKARRIHAKETQMSLESINRTLNVLAENWIIALGGRLSKAELNSGDLRYGFFPTFEDCLQAATWMLYHATQLSSVNIHIPKQLPFGIAISRCQIEGNARGNISSQEMDWAGHCLKGKLKEQLDNIAGNAGRKIGDIDDSAIQIIYHDDFTHPANLNLPIINAKRVSTDDQFLDIEALDWKTHINLNPTPWHHRR